MFNKKIVFSFIIGTMLLTGCSNTQTTNNKYELAIIHLNDVHGRAEESENDGMGYPKVASLLKEYRKTFGKDRVLFLDAGDTTHGTTFATLEKGESIVKILNAMKLDAMTLGNHDFNYGMDQLYKLENMAQFKILTSNIIDKNGQTIGEKYMIKEIDGVKVGIFGLTTPETIYKANPQIVKDLTFTDPIETSKKIVAELQAQGVKFIIALAHLGVDASTKKEWQSIGLAEAVPEIDLIVDGHSHTPMKTKNVVNGVTIVQTGEYDKNLGVVKVDFDILPLGAEAIYPTLITKEETAGVEYVEKIVPVKMILNKEYTIKQGDTLKKLATVNNTTVEAIKDINDIKDQNTIPVGMVYKLPVEKTVEKSVVETIPMPERAVKEDKKIASMIEKIKEQQTKILSEKIGETPIFLEASRERVRTGETNLANLITDAMLEKSGADLALTSGGSIRSSISAGVITIGDIINVLPFDNYVVVKELTGSEIKDMFENGFSKYPETDGRFPQFSGAIVTFNPKRPAGHRVVDVVMRNGEKLDPLKTYTVAVDNYIAVGGDEYSMFIDAKEVANYPALTEIVIEHIKKYGVSDAQIDHRIIKR